MSEISEERIKRAAKAIPSLRVCNRGQRYREEWFVRDDEEEMGGVFVAGSFKSEDEAERAFYQLIARAALEADAPALAAERAAGRVEGLTGARNALKDLLIPLPQNAFDRGRQAALCSEAETIDARIILALRSADKTGDGTI